MCKFDNINAIKILPFHIQMKEKKIESFNLYKRVRNYRITLRSIPNSLDELTDHCGMERQRFSVFERLLNHLKEIMIVGQGSSEISEFTDLRID